LKKFKKEKPRAMHNVGADRYLITYADLITLLLGLFVILYATSQVDSEKFKEISVAFSDYFKSKDDKIISGGDGVLEGHKKGIPEPILPPTSQKDIQDIEEQSTSLLAKYIKSGNIEIIKTGDGLKIILSEKLLFKSAKAEIEKEGINALDSISKILNNTNKVIMIDGHTDSDPIRTFTYESNWHLSASRATNVAYRLIKKGVPEYNLIIRGFGSQRPIDDNTSPIGKAKNRRVEIFIKESKPETPSNEGYE